VIQQYVEDGIADLIIGEEDVKEILIDVDQDEIKVAKKA
jgi:ATP-dependent Clp protease ATP-binding subunit ClpE